MSELLYGLDLLGDSAAPKPTGPVAEKFLFAPFTILDAKQGEWQERKRAWLAMGLKSEVGRGEGLMMSNQKGLLDIQRGKAIPGGSKFPAFKQDPNEPTQRGEGALESGTSIFDLVLCELAYRWFCSAGGQIVDPFCGGSVRGVLAKALGFRYWGCDLREEQVTANIENAELIFPGFEGHSLDMLGGGDLQWVCGDTTWKIDLAPAADFIFSCPPYGDLEVYSDDPDDLSNMGWDAFLIAYREIIRLSVAKLKRDRFACFVVGDFRDKDGFYRNFVSETIRAFEDGGARLYNEAILATSVGSAGLRVTRQFNANRKLAKTHQNILVFCKGDPKKAAAACKAVL